MIYYNIFYIILLLFIIIIFFIFLFFLNFIHLVQSGVHPIKMTSGVYILRIMSSTCIPLKTSFKALHKLFWVRVHSVHGSSGTFRKKVSVRQSCRDANEAVRQNDAIGFRQRKVHLLIH